MRAKKPWALAASALIMLGLTFLFTLGDYRVLASGHNASVQVGRRPGQYRVSKRGAALEGRVR